VTSPANDVDPILDPSGRYTEAVADLPEPPELDAEDEDDESAQPEPDDTEALA
jgi:hypothetical protein